MSVPPIEITSSSGWGENTSTRLGKISSRVCGRICPACLACGRLAAGPAGDRRLQVPEDLDVDVVRRPAIGQQILQAVLVVVLSVSFRIAFSSLRASQITALRTLCSSHSTGPSSQGDL